MLAYIIRRLLLIIPTLFGILLINFIIIQAAPGGPVEQAIAKLEGFEGATSRIAGGGSEVAVGGTSYRGAQGLDPELIAEIERLYGFDKPPAERFWIMLSNYLRLDFGESFFRDAKVTDLVKFVRASMKGWKYAEEHPEEAAAIVLENDETGAQTEAHQVRMMQEVAKLTAGSNGALDPADAERTVETLLSGGSDPVISKKPEGAWTSAITDKALK